MLNFNLVWLTMHGWKSEMKIWRYTLYELQTSHEDSEEKSLVTESKEW